MTTEPIEVVEHDAEADAIYVRLALGASARTKYLDDLRLVDLDGSGAAIGVEFLHVSGGIDLSGVPSRETVERLIAPFGFRVFV